MTIPLTLHVIFLLVGMFVGVMAAVVLVTKQSNKKANQYLAGLVMICVFTLLHNFLITAGIYNQKPELYFLPVILSFGIGPFLYLFINRLIFLKPLTKQATFIHLLPVIIQFLFFSFCFIQNGNTKYAIYTNYYSSFVDPFQTLITYVSVSVYLFLSFKEIAQYKQQLNDFYSNTDKIELEWLQKLLFVFMAYYATAIIFILISYSFNISENYFPSDFIRCIIIFTIAAYASKQTTLRSVKDNLLSIASPVLTEEFHLSAAEAIATSKSNDHKIDKSKEINFDILKSIIEKVENEELYLNEELTIADLASKLGYSTKTISHTINNGLHKSFSLFINEYRVNLFKKKKASGNFEHLSIMGLAYECGFNSKSSFNRIFKEITGITPNEIKGDTEEVPN